MPDVSIYKTEWYPVFDIDDEDSPNRYLTDEELAQVQAAFQAFKDAQAILSNAYDRY